MRLRYLSLLLFFSSFTCCTRESGERVLDKKEEKELASVAEKKKKKESRIEIIIEKDLLYDTHTLADEYPYKDTTRIFQWDKIRERLHFLDSIQQGRSNWAILRNYKNLNREAPLVKDYSRNAYSRIADAYGVERYQSAVLYSPADTAVGVRYGRDGSLVKYLGEKGSYASVETTNFGGRWLVPKRYVKMIGDTITFAHAVFVDRKNQNIATLEKVGPKWLVRSMNPATTGLFKPPYAQDTPLGLFIIQEKKAKMVYLKDGSQETGGYAPWASRFTNGAYLHGVPLNSLHASTIEYSATLGTTPRSHMCVRNATSHAKFIYDWAPVNQTVVFVLE